MNADIAGPWIASIVFAAVFAFVCGWNVGRKHAPTRQEQINAIVAAATPAQADDLLRLAGSGVLRATAWYEDQPTSRLEWNLRFEHALSVVETPRRDALAKVIPDIPAFEAAVIAANSAAESSKST